MLASRKLIIILEDDEPLALSLQQFLASDTNYLVVSTSSIEKCYYWLDQGSVELIIADWMLPHGQTSLELVRYCRDHHHLVKILMLTCRQGCENRLRSYRAGADGYLAKPFEIEEFRWMVQKMLNTIKLCEAEQFTQSGLMLYPDQGKVTICDQVIELRPKEMALLKMLIINSPKVVSKQRLLDSIWPNPDCQPTFNTVEVYIRRLRQLLGKYGVKLINKRGFGYCFTLESGKVQ